MEQLINYMKEHNWHFMREESNGHIFFHGGHWDDIIEFPDGWEQVADFLDELIWDEQHENLWG